MGAENAAGNTKLIGPDGTRYQGQSPNIADKFTGARSEILSAEMVTVNNDNKVAIDFINADRIRKLAGFYQNGNLDFSTYMNGVRGENIAISNDGIIYATINLDPVSHLQTHICAIKGDSPLAKSGWPRKFHDNRNTSNTDKF